MTQKKASDLFITSGRAPCLKIDGVIQAISPVKLSINQASELVYSMMNPKHRREFDETKECNFGISAEGLGRFRASAFVQRDSPGMVLRRIECDIPDAETLNLPPIINELAMTKRGLILFVGGAGMGKSTSLASMIKFRNEHSNGHIITIEDPMEFVHPHAGCLITQREVGIDTESYEVALKNTLRQSPDVILIGEIRTRETMRQAITFAETGHLCLSTLHANNADQALDRILQFFPEDMHKQLLMDLSLNLRAIIAQQLIRRSDEKGRFPAVEILLNTPLASELIRKGEIHKLKELMKQSKEQGMMTFDQALFNLYHAGHITYEDALNSADSQNEVRLMVKLGENMPLNTIEKKNIFMVEED